MKYQVACFLSLISFFSYFPSHGQYEKDAFRLYTSKDGLSNRSISGLVQDSMGYMWIATLRGLNRFDGNTFKQFYQTGETNSIPDNTIIFSKIVAGNELVIGTNDGAQIISTKSLKTKNLNIPTEDALRYWSNHTRFIEKDADGNYGVSTNTGFYIFSPEGNLKQRFDYYSVKDIGRSWMLFGRQIYQLPNGNLLQENSAGLLEYDRKNNKIHDLSTEYRALHERLSFLQASRSRIFFISKYDLMVANKETNQFDIVDIRTGKSVSFPSAFNISEEIGWQTKLSYLNNNCWAVNSQSKGFYILHIDTVARKITCDSKRYFSNYFCNILFVDNQNRLWIGTNEGMFMEKMSRKTINSFTVNLTPGVHDFRITNILIGNEKIFITDNRTVAILNKYTRQVIQQTTLTRDDPFFAINSLILFHPDTLWIGTNRGLMWLHTKNSHFGNVAINGPGSGQIEIRLMFRDKRNNFWLATDRINEIIQYTSATRQFDMVSDTTNPLFKINIALTFAEDNKGNIWIGGDAIARWNIQQQRIDTMFERVATQKNRKKGFGVMSDFNGDIWVSIMDDGIAKITGRQIPLHIRNENLVPDYSSRVVPSSFYDKIFMVTNNNIGFLNTRNLSSSVFNYYDGIPEQIITSRYFAHDSTDRSTWFACNNIICQIPQTDKNFVQAPLLSIAEVAINDSMLVFPPSTIRLNHQENDIRVIVSAVNFTDPENMRFTYRLKNNGDTNWVPIGADQNILLSNLSPGNYVLEVRLKDFDNRWPEQFKSFQITVLPPFWKTNWFLISTSLLLLFFIYLIYKWRINNVRRIEREKLQVQELKAADYRNRLELEQISNYFSSSLAGKNNVEEVLWDVARNLIGRMGYVDCMIYLWNKDKTKMIQKAGFGPKGSPEAIESQVFDVLPGQGVVGYVVETKQPVLIPDTRKDRRYRMDEMFRLSEICVPIIHNGELMGIIDSEHHELDYFKERDIKILTTIATLVGDKIKQIESEKSLEIKEEELTRINNQLAAAQLAALQTQMNPHFIFNALNSIKRMILDDEKQNASRYLSKFAQMIRLTLNHSKETFVTLQENIEYLQAYLEMEQLRFDDSFAFHIETNNNVDEEDTLVPSLMIQPLVENAIWHGLMHQVGEKQITIRFDQNHDKIICSIEDNGIGIHESERRKLVNNQPHRSVGLDNLRNRIKIMNEKYLMNCSLNIIDRSESNVNLKGTVAILKFKIMNQ